VYSWGSVDCHLGHDEPAGGAEVGLMAGVRVRSVGLGCAPWSNVFAAVTENGSLFTWGSIVNEDDVGGEGPSGIGYPASETDEWDVEVPRRVILSGVCVRSVALGYAFSLILADDGRLFSCGLAEHGVLGHGDQVQDVVRPKQIEALRGVRVCGVAAGWELSLALTADGRAYSWGTGPDTGHGIANVVFLPMMVEALADERVSLVAAGGAHACAVTEAGALFTWGRDREYGGLGHGDEAAQRTPRAWRRSEGA
jgi:alpha-tubulin suppressor-like RCC1 family protein